MKNTWLSYAAVIIVTVIANDNLYKNVYLNECLSNYYWQFEKAAQRPFRNKNVQDDEIIFLYGKWKLFKDLGGSRLGVLTKEQAQAYLGKSLFVSKSLIVLDGDSCIDPKYDMSRQEDMRVYLLENYKTRASLVGIKEGIPTKVFSISCGKEVVHHADSLPVNFEIFVQDDRVIMDYKSNYYEIKKVSLPANSKTIQLGDTVRCRYGSQCRETGYVIQGSRKGRDKAIHVKPNKTNIPMEK